MAPRSALRAIKILHTVVWAFFVAVIVGIPALAWRERYGWVAVLTAVVVVEGVVLAVNGMRCPLTDIAARYTEDRRDNFDIYLPLWVARWNKWIFGPLFVVGVVFAVVRWLV